MSKEWLQSMALVTGPSWMNYSSQKLTTENPYAYIETPKHPKLVTVWCGFWSRGIIGTSSKISKEMSVQSMVIVIWPYFDSKKFKRRIMATFGLKRTALRAIQPKLRSMFCDLFLRITLSAAKLLSFAHLEAAIWQRWTNICGVPSKISVTPTIQRQLTL